jgi:hypothetical protein
MSCITRPTIIIERDFDGYFEGLAKQIVDIAVSKNRPFITHQIVVTSGPWRCVALSVNCLPSTGEINLDFYSAIRNGFGSLSQADLEGAAEMLLEKPAL